MSNLFKIALPPGLLKRGTAYQSAGRWYDANLVRFETQSGDVVVVKPIGGWIARTDSAMEGKCRAALAWKANDTTRLLAFGTHTKLYAMTQTETAPHDITPVGFTTGDADAEAGGGYGAGPYGEGLYGTPRIDVADVQPATMWTLDTFGEDLVCVSDSDQTLYQWELDVNTPAVAVVGAPALNAVVVTAERFVFALGAGGDNRKVQWADQESLTDWTPSATDQAGDITLSTQGELQCGARIRGGTLLWTDLDVHLATYIGQPFIYRFDRLGENCGIVSRGAFAVADDRAAWMGYGAFFSYDGAVRRIPCEIQDAVFGDFNVTQRSKVTCFHNVEFSEIWWFYPSSASTEIDRAAVLNYQEGHWGLHEIVRLCAIPRGIFTNPIMVDADGDVWDHETGSDYDGDSPYAETGPIELGNGDRIMRVRRLIADELTSGDVTATFKVRDWPNDNETSFGPYTIANPTPVRFSGRQVRLRIDGDAMTNWRWGTARLDLMEGSRR